jgi:radical SAM superfamily enzyme YgiQ (UPF0313 family)
MARGRECNALMVHPRFNANSFWNYQATCDLVGANYPAPPLGLLTVAAMLPESWTVRLVDLNTGNLTEEDWAWADLVMTGGMMPQQRDTLRLIQEAQSRGLPVVVGGPDVTSSPHVYSQADFQVLGEAEGIMDQFLEAWHAGAPGGVFEGVKFKADVTKSPMPRFELLDFRKYLHVGVQFSRGCPFSCEFCDIIELYGRVPRMKTNEQMLAELDRLYALGYRGHVDFVDDNLIGNKKALKQFLPALKQWLIDHKYPFEFSTEASLNLADDPELLQMLKDCGFFAIFVGIESPDTETLVHTQKRQNTRRSIAESIHKIYHAGIFVNAGFIVGFDTEKASIADAMAECVEDTAIPACMIGLLYALPNTQLTRRLTTEGRLAANSERVGSDDETDQCTAGLNFETLRPRRDVLRDYKQVLEQIYTPAAYFARTRRVGKELDCSERRTRWPLRHMARDVRTFLRMIWRMGIRGGDMRWEFWKTLAHCLTRNPMALRYVVSMLLLYLHLGPFARYVAGRLGDKIDEIDRGDWTPPRITTLPIITPPPVVTLEPVIQARNVA